jgi:hypothetical protein
MVKSLSELQFPLLVYTPRYLMGGVSNKKQLHVVSGKKLTAGCFDNGVVIDSTGARYRILSSNKKEVPSLTILHIIKAIFGWDRWDSKPVWAELEINFTNQLNLDSMKTEILDIFFENKTWYSKYGHTKLSISALVEDATTIEDLITRISIYP